jgi:OmcA/MtrC family decaheme c-type cytochrome
MPPLEHEPQELEIPMRSNRLPFDFRPALAALLALAFAGCSGDTGPQGPQGPPGPPGSPLTNTVLERKDDAPGVQVTVVSMTGASGAAGQFEVGDHIAIKYSLAKDDGSPWILSEMGNGRAIVSGPTFNYQRVLPEKNDVVTASVDNGDGTYTYTFADPIPAVYAAPLNDSPSFGPADGELAGQALLSGTYTLGLYFSWSYTVDENSYKDAGDAVQDFMFGSATQIDVREVVKQDNCNVCHTELAAHGDLRRNVRVCLLCHTAGAEDRNGAAAGGTPGVSIDFRIMIHRIHNGSHLPSVNGVTALPDGSIDYTATPAPYQVVGHNDSINDFSDIKFPVWPNFNVAMPKNRGYSQLSSSERARSDAIRTGITNCAKCHGDPDGAGPLTAPSQGDIYKTQPTENACGSCHDDIHWGLPYSQNQQTMPGTANNSNCVLCHPAAGGSLSVTAAHLHPLENSALDAGVNLVITGVTGGTGTGGNFQLGDTPVVDFTLKNDLGTDIGLATMDASSAFFFGPNSNRQLIMPLTSANGMAVTPFDSTGRLQAASSSGKGSMSKVFLGTPAVKETLTVQFTTGTTFTVTGSVSGALGTGTLPAATSVLPGGASISAFDIGAGVAANETVVVAFTTATHFTVSGSISGLFGSGDLPASTSASTRFTSTNLSFNVSVGSNVMTGGVSMWNLALFRGSAASPVAFAVVAGTTAFSSAAPRPDRFYCELWPDAASYSLRMPMDLTYEFLGDGNGVVGQTLTAGNIPVYYGRQQLWQATTTATATSLMEEVAPFARSARIQTTAGFLNNDIVVITSGAVGQREYVQIAPERADGVIQAAAPSGDPSGTAVKLNFKTPLRYLHGAGDSITKVTLALRQEGGAGNDYGLNSATGTITSHVAFTSGAGMVMSYRSDARFGYARDSSLPASPVTTYVPPANDSTDIGQEQGDWQGLPYQDGTYTADLWVSKNIDHGLQGELQTYRSTANAGTFDFLYGSATQIEPHAIISSSANCYTCHNDLIFHGGGRRGLDACLTCHSISGNEDKPRWDTPNQSGAAPATPTPLTPGVAIALAYGGTPNSYAEVEFPAMPAGVRQCVRCHGNDAWKSPANRSHASADVPVRTWGVVCGACHDSDAAQAHIAVQTSMDGAESCSVCHGTDRDWSVEVMHKPR